MPDPLEALSSLFAVVDDVMSEPDAFTVPKLKVGLGRIYRQWLDTREALDPDFDRDRYRQEMKG